MDLRQYLDENDLSAAKFAEKIGVTPMSIFRYLRRERVPQAEVLARIIAETGGKVTPNDFFGIAEDGAPASPEKAA